MRDEIESAAANMTGVEVRTLNKCSRAILDQLHPQSKARQDVVQDLLVEGSLSLDEAVTFNCSETWGDTVLPAHRAMIDWLIRWVDGPNGGERMDKFIDYLENAFKSDLAKVIKEARAQITEDVKRDQARHDAVGSSDSLRSLPRPPRPMVSKEVQTDSPPQSKDEKKDCGTSSTKTNQPKSSAVSATNTSDKDHSFQHRTAALYPPKFVNSLFYSSNVDVLAVPETVLLVAEGEPGWCLALTMEARKGTVAEFVLPRPLPRGHALVPVPGADLASAKTFVIGGLEDDAPTDTVEMMSIADGKVKLEKQSKLCRAVAYPAACVVQRQLWVLGGSQNGPVNCAQCRASPKSAFVVEEGGEGKSLAPTLSAAVAVPQPDSSFIFLLGGFGEGGAVSTAVWRLNHAGDPLSCHSVGDLAEKLRDFAATATREHGLVASGGRTEDGVGSAEVRCASLTGGDGGGTLAWSNLEPLPFPLWGHRMEWLAGQLVVVGGNTKDAPNLRVLALRGNKWDEVAELPHPLLCKPLDEK